ncbi:MAG: exodeoxyribonuclease VII small subunit [Candidatus Woesebacteria bacterium]|jgi:exodeoxyribonuclease VII small subunit
MSEKNPKTISQQLNDLDELLAWFDKEDLDLDEALKKFDEGAKLADEVKGRLSVLENKITILKQKFDRPEESL